MSCSFELDHYAELRGLGHAVGLHAVHPNTTRDDRFDAVLSWHNPDPESMFEPVDGVVSVMQSPCFTDGNYRSDWREGCPHEELRAWLQVLIHPDAKHEKWLEHLANDRIDL